MIRSIVLIITCLFMVSCHTKRSGRQDVIASHDTKSIDTSFARGFSIKNQGNNKILKIINPWQNARGVEFTYILSDTLASSEIINEYTCLIKTPVRKVICLSTTHIGFINFLGRVNSISGISGKNYVVNDELRTGIEKGLVPDVGYDENLNYELILKAKPDVVFAYGVNITVTNTIKKLNELGIPVVLIGEYLEQEPLAKMEWVKVFAALYGQTEQASLDFDSTVIRYNNLVNLAKDVKKRHSVLLGLPWRGTWYISGSKSYIARLVNDAGGRYLFDQFDFNESRPIGLEKIYENALNAEFWINSGDARSKKDILSVDERFGNLPCFRNDKVFNNNNWLAESGGNAFFEQGVVEPDIILSDLICILHPQLLPSHRLKFYRKLQ